jgi:hypothetical protein
MPSVENLNQRIFWSKGGELIARIHYDLRWLNVDFTDRRPVFFETASLMERDPITGGDRQLAGVVDLIPAEQYGRRLRVRGLREFFSADNGAFLRETDLGGLRVEVLVERLPGWERLDDDDRDYAADSGYVVSRLFDLIQRKRRKLRRGRPLFRERRGGPPLFRGVVRPPEPSITYDIGGTLAAAQYPWSGEVQDFHDKLLVVLRSLTAPDGFIYAVSWDHPLPVFDAYRFWPHRAEPTAPWAVGIPSAAGWDEWWSEYVFAPDSSWGLMGEVIENEWRGLVLFGQPLLDAVERNKPSLLSKIVAIDGEPADVPAQSDRRAAAQLNAEAFSILLGINVATLKEHALCDPELQSRYDECMAAEGLGQSEDEWRTSLAELTAMVEARLEEHHIPYTSALDAL